MGGCKVAKSMLGTDGFGRCVVNGLYASRAEQEEDAELWNFDDPESEDTEAARKQGSLHPSTQR